MNIVKVLFLKADTLHNSYTSAPGEDLGRFRLRGANNTATNLNHQIVLTDIADDGHSLLVNVNYGRTSRFTVENTSDPASDCIFAYKHSGQTKKKFKPGDIISPPETHVLMWDALNLSGEPVKVVLTLTSLPHRHGLRLHYSLLKP